MPSQFRLNPPPVLLSVADHSVAHSVVDSVAHSVAHSVARSVADSVADSVARFVADSVARSVALSVACSVVLARFDLFDAVAVEMADSFVINVHRKMYVVMENSDVVVEFLSPLAND